MKPRKMRPSVLWAVVTKDGWPIFFRETRAQARGLAIGVGERVVRVRVTEAP